MKMELNILKRPVILSTQRLKISSMAEQDWPQFKRPQSDPELMKYIGPILDESELKQKFVDRIKPWQEDDSHWMTLKIMEEDTGEFAGSIGFRFIDITSKRAERGYLLLQSQQGKGIIVEAGQALLNYLFNKVDVQKIKAQCYLKNTASWKVILKPLSTQ